MQQTLIIASEDETLRRTASEVLAHRYSLSFREPTDAQLPAACRGAAGVILDCGTRRVACVRTFEKIRKLDPDARVLITDCGFDAETAVELIKVGAVDLLGVPMDAQRLLYKVVRATTAAQWPAFDINGLSQVPPRLEAQTHVRAETAERRAGFRVALSADNQCHLLMRVGNLGLRLPVQDLSIGMMGTAAGVAVIVEKPTFRQAVAALKPKMQVSAWLELPRDPKQIPLQCAVVRVTSGLDNSLLLAMSYQTPHRADATRIRCFWTQAQRRKKLDP